MSKLWTNFAKTGYNNNFFLFKLNFMNEYIISELSMYFCFRNPNSQDLDFKWENTSVNDPKYLTIDGDNTKMVDGLLYKSRIQFWEDIEKSQAVLL